MKKRVAALTLAMVMCFAVTACGDKSAETTETNVETTEESIVEESTISAEEATEAESAEAATEETAVTETAADETEATTEDTTEEAAGVELKAEIPDGFTEAAEGMYMNPDYPNDGTNIIIMTTQGSAEEIPSEEAFKEQLMAALGDTEMEVEMENYEKYEVSGYDAVRMTMKYSIEGVELSQTYVMVFADGVMGSAIYTAQGDAWNDAIEASIASITMEQKFRGV